MITSSVAFGFILAHQRTLGPDQVYYESLLDQAAAAGVSTSASQIVFLGAARILVGRKGFFHLIYIVNFCPKKDCDTK